MYISVMYVYVYIYIYILIITYIHTYVYMYIYIYIHTHIYICIYICIYMYMYVYIYMYMLFVLSSFISSPPRPASDPRARESFVCCYLVCACVLVYISMFACVCLLFMRSPGVCATEGPEKKLSGELRGSPKEGGSNIGQHEGSKM